MRQIWKYTIPVVDEITVTIPRPARPISAVPHLSQDGTFEINVYFEVTVHEDDRLTEDVDRTIHIYGTGNPMVRCFEEHIETIIEPANDVWPEMIWHVYVSTD